MVWWPLAWSAELRSKPLAVNVCGEELVLFRGLQGKAQALEDRCPHRRVPLSLGRVTADGELQCGYHGWIYDGVSGQCTKIPNFRGDERVSPRIKAASYPVVERSGVIFVGFTASGSDAPDIGASDFSTSCTGRAELSLRHETWMRIFLHSPGSAVGLGAALGAIKSHRVEGDSLVFDEPLQNGNGLIRTRCWAGSGYAQMQRINSSGLLNAQVDIASLPDGDGGTQVRWRYAQRGVRWKFTGLLVKLLPALLPITVSQGLALQSDIEAGFIFNEWCRLSRMSSDERVA